MEGHLQKLSCESHPSVLEPSYEISRQYGSWEEQGSVWKTHRAEVWLEDGEAQKESLGRMEGTHRNTLHCECPSVDNTLLGRPSHCPPCPDPGDPHTHNVLRCVVVSMLRGQWEPHLQLGF